MSPLVSIIMGSSSDAPIMEAAAKVLDRFGVAYEFTVVSAHRSPEILFEFGRSVVERGIRVVIAGAGGAAHLPGMVASLTPRPVIGVPILSSNSLQGWDSLLSIAQMPSDVPVATMAVNGAHNAGILAVQMLALADEKLTAALLDLKQSSHDKVLAMRDELAKREG